jgi:RimJ/RimL family protein N-acetyltransferase
VRLPDAIHRDDLVLRRWREDEAEALGEAVTASIEHLRPWMPWIADEPMTLADRRALIARWTTDWEAGRDVIFGIFEEGAVAGCCGLHHRGDPDGLEIGYWVHVDRVRRGIATRAARALTEVAFTVPGIEWVDICHDRANTASGAVPRHLGFTMIEEMAREPAAPAETGIHWRWRIDRWSWTTPPDRHVKASSPVAQGEVRTR